MTQAQLDLQNLQNQFEQQTINTDLTTQTLFNDSPVLLYEVMEQHASVVASEQTSSEQNNFNLEQIEHQTPPEKQQTFPETNNYEQSLGTPPPPAKKRYEVMKDPAILFSPTYPPILPSKLSLSTNRNDHLIPLLSHNRFIFKSQLALLLMHYTDYTFKLYDKNQDFFTSIASNIVSLYQYWLDNGVKTCSLQFNFLRPPIFDLKTDENDPTFLSSQKITHH